MRMFLVKVVTAMGVQIGRLADPRCRAGDDDPSRANWVTMPTMPGYDDLPPGLTPEG
jgi:hypothetical protein